MTITKMYLKELYSTCNDMKYINIYEWTVCIKQFTQEISEYMNDWYL